MVKKLSLNIVIPVYNEERNYYRAFALIRRFAGDHLSDFDWIITIADNASTDKTLSIGREIARKDPCVRVIHLDQKGRGRAVKVAWESIPTDYVAYMDVDLSTDLKHLPALVGSLTRGYDVAIGSRNAHGSRVYGRSLLRTITSKGYILLIKLFFWVHFSDAQCGFKATTRHIWKSVPSVVDNEWFFDSELLILAENQMQDLRRAGHMDR